MESRIQGVGRLLLRYIYLQDTGARTLVRSLGL